MLFFLLMVVLEGARSPVELENDALQLEIQTLQAAFLGSVISDLTKEQKGDH